MGPNLSILQESAIAPVRGTRPNDGRNPVHPQRVDGEEIEPSVSDPMLNATHPAAVAEAGPAEEPPEPLVVFPGFFVSPPQQTTPRAPGARGKFANRATPASSRRLSKGAAS